MSKMTLTTEGDRYVVAKRCFAAPPEAVYRAHTEPKLIQKWMLGPEGWTMPVCICEARANGKIRYEWMTLPDPETRARMLATGMEHGMETSYVRLEGMI